MKVNLRRSRLSRLILVFGIGLFCSISVFSQQFSFGIVGGASLTSDFVDKTVHPYTFSRTYSTAKDYIVGPMIGVALSRNVSVELDALYRSMNFTSETISSDGTVGNVSPNTVVTWEFPALLQYKFKESALPIRPLLEVGPSFRSSGNLNGTSPSILGITAGAGIETHFWKLRVTPQLRYTRWRADKLNLPWQAITKQDQLELLVSFSF
jgi:hypothetical protein